MHIVTKLIRLNGLAVVPDRKKKKNHANDHNDQMRWNELDVSSVQFRLDSDALNGAVRISNVSLVIRQCASLLKL